MGQRLCEALSSKFKLREACYLLLPAVIAVGLSAEVSPAASYLPSNQQVIAFLTESIDWYRHSAIERQIATEPSSCLPGRQSAGCCADCATIV